MFKIKISLVFKFVSIIILVSIQLCYAAPPYVTFKFDDLGEQMTNWRRFVAATNLCKAKGATATCGIFGKRVSPYSSEYTNYVKSLCNDTKTYEVWFHGYTGDASEFFGTSYADQKSSFVNGRNALLSQFDYLMRTYSEHYNGGDQTTVQVFNEDPYLRVWLWPSQSGVMPDAVLPTTYATLESATAVFNTYSNLVANYNNDWCNREFLVLQGHPWGWGDDANSMNTFSQFLDFLNSKGVKYINEWNYYKMIRNITDTTAPQSPTGIELARIDSKKISITWNASVDRESVIDGYKIFRSGKFVAITSTTSYTDTSSQNLPDSTQYQISAINGANLSSTKSTSASLLLGSYITPKDPTNPGTFSLSQNYPNPFNPTTNIEYQIANSGLVNLKIFDVLGREVATLVNAQKSIGSYTVQWDASNFPSGMYLSRLTVQSQECPNVTSMPTVLTKKVLFTK